MKTINIHPYIVHNYREMFAQLNVPTDHFTDDELAAVIEHWSGMATPEEQFDAILQDVADNTKR